MSESGEKTEEPTQKKIDDSRRKGQVWKSRDLTGVAVFLVGLGALKATWDLVESRLMNLFQFGFDAVAHPQGLEIAIPTLLFDAVTTVMLLSLPVAAAGAILGALVDFLQVGPIFTMETLQFKLDKLNPIEGIKNMVSKKQIVEILKSTVKICVTGYVVFGVVRDAMPMVVGTIGHDIHTIFMVMGELVYRVAIRVGILFLVFSIFDVWWQHRVYYKDLMMTKEEVKKEYKESEGDPHHKAHRKQLHQEILESAQMEAVAGADVVVTNPDHVAVALKYDKEKDTAPRVIAKGIDLKAESIKALARKGDVSILRNVPLAHSLLRVDVGQEIPEELYDAVAEVLNFVYGLRQQEAAAAKKPAA